LDEPSAVVRAVFRALWRDLETLGPPPELLFRTTEGFNREAVLRHGTDRHGRPDRPLSWRERGYRGPERAWGELIFATPRQEVERRLAGRSPRPTALDKVPETTDAHVIVYDASCFERVRAKEYAIAPGASFLRALVALYRVEGGVERLYPAPPP